MGSYKTTYYATKKEIESVRQRGKDRIVKELNELVGKRFSKESLDKKLSSIFNEKIKSEFSSNDEEIYTDWNIMFNSNNKGTCGYFDIYVLKMRRKGYDGSTFFVTEISYEFE